MKRVYLDVLGKTHSLYNGFVRFPPEGYEFIVDPVSLTETALKYRPFFSFQRRYLSYLVPLNLVKAYLQKWKKIPQDADLTCSAGHLVFRKEPWVVHLEAVFELVGYRRRHFKRYKKIIERNLASRNCKSIFCWTEAGKRTVIENLDSRNFEHKVEVVLLAVPKKDFVKDYSSKDTMKLLFIGSANLPEDFEVKGGKEAIETFIQLTKKYDNLELVIRSWVPQYIKNRCAQFKNIRIIDEMIPMEMLEQEFKSSDIFLFPSHNTPGLAILEAKSYELPVVTTDVWGNPELIKDGETGFMVNKSEKIQYYVDNFVPNWGSPESMKIIKGGVDPKVIEQLVAKTSLLIEDEDLRRRMGRAGRQEIETGKFSIGERNLKLKKIFDEAIE
ncbi:glycosyltransferase family 4 protein [Chloroflexota bacterium]